MTNNQEKLLRGKLTKWLQAKGETPEDVERKTNAWLQYFDGIKKPVVVLAACTWLCSGAVILPEDMPKVEQAVKVAEINRVDPLRFDRPMAVFEAFPSTELKEAPIDPDTVPTLHLARRFDSGLAIYDVDESYESRENMRRIINTHFGKDSSPWCLLQGDGEGNLTKDSLKYWNHYNAYTKQVAFFDGTLVAFSANDNGEKIWWDRMDKSHWEIVVLGRIKGDPLGRSAACYFYPDTGDVRYENIIRRRNDYLVERYADIKDKKFSIHVLVDRKKKEKIVSVVIPNGVRVIGNGAFYDCRSMEVAYIPEGVRYIGGRAFEDCSSMERVYIPNSVENIGWGAFWGCNSLEEVHVPATASRALIDMIHKAIPPGCAIVRDLPKEDLVALDGLGLPKEDIDVLSKTGCLKGEDFDFVIKDDGRVWCCTVETAVRLEDAIKYVDEEERKDSVSIDLSRGKGI